MAKDTQRCTKCGEEKSLLAYRRQSHRPNGRDTICRACRKAAYHRARAASYGPLPEAEGSAEWLAEVRRRALLIRIENAT